MVSLPILPPDGRASDTGLVDRFHQETQLFKRSVIKQVAIIFKRSAQSCPAAPALVI